MDHHLNILHLIGACAIAAVLAVSLHGWLKLAMFGWWWVVNVFI